MDAEVPTADPDAGDASEEELCPEAPAVRTRKAPELPTQAEVAAHDALHCPYRSWCEICVAASGKEDRHTRTSSLDTDTGLPVLSLDYEFLEGPVTVLVGKIKPSGAVLAYTCAAKGPSDTWVVSQIARDLEAWGMKDICLKTDGEPAMLAMQEAIARARTSRTIPRNPPAYNPQSNGTAEKAVQDVAGQLRRLTLALEARLHQRISAKLPVMAWLVRHAAFVLTHFQVGHDGLTPWRRMTGRHWSGSVAEFGEQVMGKLPKKQVGPTKKAKRGKTKLEPRSIRGTWLGIWPRTGEHLIAAHTGEVIRVRTIHRLPTERHWDAATVLAIRATPRNPGARGEPEPKEAAEKPEAVEIARPEHQDAHGPARELKIDARLLEKYGFTVGCTGCQHVQRDLGSRRAHSSRCRQRIYELMKEDPAEIDRLIAADERLRRAQPKEELTRRAKQGFPADPRDRAEFDKTQSESASAEPPYVPPLSRTDTPTVLEPRGGDDADMNGDPPSDSEYAGFPGMSADIDDEATADCFPVPESDSESDSDDEAMPQLDIAPQATAETPQAAWEDASPGGAVRPRDDVDSDIASVRAPEHSPKKARLAALDALSRVQVPNQRYEATEPAADDPSRSTQCSMRLQHGDLFEVTPDHSLCHCISKDLRMGSGIAVEFLKKYGGLEELRNQRIGVGGVGVLRREGRYIYYLVTKDKYHNKPSLNALRASLLAMRKHIAANGIKRLAMPMIGCGLDRLAWEDVKDLILTTFSTSPLEIQVRTLSRTGLPTQRYEATEPAAEDIRTPAGRGKEELQSLFRTSTVKRILEDLSQRKEFQLPKSGTRELLLADEWKTECGEIYSPPRVTQLISEIGLRPAWSLDLTTSDPEDGKPWDFSFPDKRAKAIKMLDRDKPLMLIACPMCGPFSAMNNLNYAKMSAEETEEKLKSAMMHLKFSMDVCLRQYKAGRMFVFEHPTSASSWSTDMVKHMANLEGVYTAKFDFCQLGMLTKDGAGKDAPAKKRTTVLTNFPNLAEVLRRAQCQKTHQHQQLIGGRAGACQVYPRKFVELIGASIRKEIADAQWRNGIASKLGVLKSLGVINPEDFQQSMEKLMAAIEKIEPPHEPEASVSFAKLYADHEFVDDMTGMPLDHGMAVTARKMEIDFFKSRGVYTKVKREPWMKVITTKWIDHNKGDLAAPNYRARLVGREVAHDKRDDLYAATPPLESLKAILALCASRQGGPKPSRIMALDVARAYFYAEATRAVFIHIPAEDKLPGDEGCVAKLNLCLYGTRDAAKNWTSTYTAFLNEVGFETGKGSTCNFCHHEREISMTVHGDDFTACGSDLDLAWLSQKFRDKFEVKIRILGPDRKHEQEVRILNRVVRWTDSGLTYEPDQRHAEMVIRDLGLENAKIVTSPGTKEDQALASVPPVGISVEIEDDTPLLNTVEAKLYRGVTARCNYLAQDRVDIQYACKECSRRMARPRQGDWAALKRIGRYLKGAPRLIQQFVWQELPKTVDVFTDSDWAGCKSTCRSTSGGITRFGDHTLKTWSSTQATVALSSAEAELYALTKGAAQALGFITLLADLGVQVTATVHTDASAAIGIARRAGLGKLRHLNVRYLWLQHELSGTELTLHKVHGLANPADLVTKHLAHHVIKKHMDILGIWVEGGRAASAPTLSSVATAAQEDEWKEPAELVAIGRPDEAMVWPSLVRVHRKPRRDFFTPMKVQGAPAATSIAQIRMTKGKFLDNGEMFSAIDNWTRRDGKAHDDMGRQWTGTTTFIKRSADDEADACGNWNYARAIPHLKFLSSTFQTSPSGSAVPPLSIRPCCAQTNLDWRGRERCWMQGYKRPAFLG